MAVMGGVLNLEAADLARSIRKSLSDLSAFRNSLPETVRHRLRIRVHQTLPSSSAILLDHHEPAGRIQLETKPYKAGLQKSFAFEVGRVQEGGLYDVLARAYDALVADGEEFDVVVAKSIPTVAPPTGR